MTSNISQVQKKSEDEINEEGDSLKEQYITFRVDVQEYAVNITSVREIKGWVDTTSLPNSPDYMRGVVNLRGTVVPILDLRSRFNIGFTEVSSTHVVMIVNLDSRVVGILVDAVCDILTIDSSEVRSVPGVNQDNGINVVSGLVQKDKKMVALLMLDKLFDSSIEMLQKPQISQEIMENMSSFN